MSVHSLTRETTHQPLSPSRWTWHAGLTSAGFPCAHAIDCLPQVARSPASSSLCPVCVPCLFLKYNTCIQCNTCSVIAKQHEVVTSEKLGLRLNPRVRPPERKSRCHLFLVCPSQARLLVCRPLPPSVPVPLSEVRVVAVLCVVLALWVSPAYCLSQALPMGQHV